MSRADNVRPEALSTVAIVAIAVIVVAAAGLRLWNIGAGIPYSVGPDEPQIMNRVALMMKTGDFNPHFFDWPSLTFYLNLVVACFTFLVGAMRGVWNSLDQVGAPELYLAGRQFTALIGTATVAVTFSAARRWGTGVALISAALVAVQAMHVRESHYVLTDVPTTLFTTLTLLLSLRAHEQPTRSRIFWAAASAGLAASCKYNGAIAIVMPLTMVWTMGAGLASAVSRTFAVIGIAFGAFLIGTPYAVLDLPKFLSDYGRLAAVFANRPITETGWIAYPKYIWGALGWPASIAAAVGGGLALWKTVTGPNRARPLMLVGFTALYFSVMAQSHQIYGRYLLPLLPFLSLFCGIGVAAGIRRLRATSFPRNRVTWLSAAVVIAALAMPAAGGVGFARYLGQASTVDLAYNWFLANVPEGTKVAVEFDVLRLPNRYETVSVRSLLDRSFDDYAGQGITYILAASPTFQATLTDPQGNREALVLYRQLLHGAVLVAAFDPSAEVRGPSMRLFRIPR